MVSHRYREEASRVQEAVLRVVRTVGGEAEPAQVIHEARTQVPGVAEEVARGAIWSLVNSGRLELTWDGHIRAR
jgi:hypothetical protein